jgi:two-component system sensor histidine kinase/response regulator
MKKQPEAASYNLNHKTILVVDDDGDMRHAVDAILTGDSFHVLQAENGIHALEHVKHEVPDLILCDIAMPLMDGYEFLKAIRENPNFSRIPFVFLTGIDEKRYIRDGMLSGADDYLTKPFTSEELRAIVRIQLEKQVNIQRYYESQVHEVQQSIGLLLPHEIRTPLNIILGYAQVLQREDDVPLQTMKIFSKNIFTSAQRLQHLLENINLFTQLNYWKNDEEKIRALRSQSTYSMKEIVESIAVNKSDQCEHIQIDMKNQIIQISTNYLTKLLEELIDNAIKFSSHNGNIKVTGIPVGNEYQITVRDEGRGMSAEQIQKISAYLQFERRYYEQQGAGLGLVIAKLLAELHGGSLHIESEPKKGTIVTVFFKTVENIESSI